MNHANQSLLDLYHINPIYLDQALYCIKYLKDRVWIDHSSIDIWLMRLWDSLPQPQARYIPSIFITPVEVGGGEFDPAQLNEEIDRFRELFELPPLETMIYVLNCGQNLSASGNHFCVVFLLLSQKQSIS